MRNITMKTIADYLFRGIRAVNSAVNSVTLEVAEVEEPTLDQKMFREYIRDLNTPKILPPDEYIDPYAIVWEGKGNRYGKKTS